ncbi:MAG: TIGR02594 family protein [Bernardetiaceae bacterium]
MSKLIDIASAEIGVEEIVGEQHHPRILQYAHEAGFDWVTSDETPWCSIFLNWVAHKAGYPRTHDGRARSWLKVGQPVQEPQPGDVILVGNNGDPEKIYHVGLFTGFTADGQQVFCLGGNQTNRVSITRYWRKNIVGYRRLAPLDVPLDATEKKNPAASPEAASPDSDQQTAPAKTPPPPPAQDIEKNILAITNWLLSNQRIQYGSRGEKVRGLQIALNRLGYRAGPEDGIFGAVTETALKEFQADQGIRVTGKLTRRTRRLLKKTL